MRHPEAWYAQLSARLGHPGFVTLAEIRRAESRKEVTTP